MRLFHEKNNIRHRANKIYLKLRHIESTPKRSPGDPIKRPLLFAPAGLMQPWRTSYSSFPHVHPDISQTLRNGGQSNVLPSRSQSEPGPLMPPDILSMSTASSLI